MKAQIQKSATLLLTLLMLSLPLPALSKAYFAGRKEMVEKADLIALVDVAAVEKCDRKGEPFSYSQKAPARVLQVYKGKCGGNLTIYGGENFICARLNIEPGKALAFLRKEKEEGAYTGSNWHLSLLPVTANGKQVKWLKAPQERELSELSLAAARQDIKDDLECRTILEQSPAFIKTIYGAQRLAGSAVGEGAEKSPLYLAYLEALKNAAKYKKELTMTARYGSPAGRLYAVSALAAGQAEAARKLLTQMSNCKDNVYYQSGCKGTNELLGTISQELVKKGRYLDFELGKD